MSRRLTINTDTFAVMVALASGPKSGRQVQSQIVGDTLGMYVRDSVIYGALHRFVDLGWADDIPGGFALTDRGRQVLKMESRTFENLLEKVKQRLR